MQVLDDLLERDDLCREISRVGIMRVVRPVFVSLARRRLDGGVCEGNLSLVPTLQQLEDQRANER